MAPVLLGLLLVLSSCSGFSPREGRKVNLSNPVSSLIIFEIPSSWQKIISDDLGKLKSLSSSWYLYVLKFTHHLSSEELCLETEVACSFPQSPYQVFLGPKFFSLSQWERLGTLVHESFHQEKDRRHERCGKEDCDKSWDSAYGKEVEFYTRLAAADSCGLCSPSDREELKRLALKMKKHLRI